MATGNVCRLEVKAVSLTVRVQHLIIWALTSTSITIARLKFMPEITSDLVEMHVVKPIGLEMS